MSRGNARAKIYWDEVDRFKFLDVLSAVVSRFKWLVHAYCLMDNHYHLIVETPLANLSAGMRQLNGVYTQRINRRYKRCGHLLQGRFKAMLIEKDRYLLEAARYIVLNPVRAGICSKPVDWEWSSYRPTAGLGRKPDFLETDWILERFSRRRAQALRLYAAFVAEGIAAENPFTASAGGLMIGSEDFIRKIRAMLNKLELTSEHPLRERRQARPSLEELFAGRNMNPPDSQAKTSAHSKSLFSNLERDAVIRSAVNVHGYRLKEVGDFLGLHYSTVSKIASNSK
jgi:REP element-mobilizing transposase RayT